MPLIWNIPDSYPEGSIGRYDATCSPDRFLFRKGCSLGNLPPAAIRFTARAERLRQYDCLSHSAMIPLINERLASVLKILCPSEVELFPAIVHAKDGELNGYCLVNATGEVDAVDFARSSVVLIPGTSAVLKFNQLRHLPDALNGLHIARERNYRSHLLVSESLAGQLLQEGGTGLQFTRPEEIHP